MATAKTVRSTKRKTKRPADKKGDRGDRKIVARLLEKDKQLIEGGIETGRKDGEDWAKNTAAIHELRNLDRFVANGGLELFEAYTSTIVTFIEAIRPGELIQSSNVVVEVSESIESDTFDQTQIIAGEVGPDYMRGFVEGAVAVWRRVKPKMPRYWPVFKRVGIS